MVFAAATTKPAGRPIGDKWAVVIGCSNFADPTIPTLKYCAKDAKDFARFLTDANGGRFQKDHVKVLTNEEATKVNILDTVGDSFLPHAALPGDLVVIYLSTHGSPAAADVCGVNYVVAYDTKVNKLFATGIEMKDFVHRIKERVHTDRILFVMDTCFSGAGAEGGKGIVRTNADPAEIVKAQGGGAVVISSSSPNQVSWESDRLQNSFFTKYLIDALKANGSEITIEQAFNSMKEQVQQSVLKEKGEMQTPILAAASQGSKLVIAARPSAPHEAPYVVLDGAALPTAPTHSAARGSSKGYNFGEYAQHIREAKNLQAAHRYWDAVHEAELSLKSDPRSIEACLVAAEIYDSQGRYDKSFESAKRAVLNSDGSGINSAGAHEQLALAYLRNNDPTEALRQIQTAVSLDPTSSTAHNLLGYINEHGFNRDDLAEQEYRRALAANAANVRALVNLGQVLQKQSPRSQEAEQCFRKAIEADADDWQAHLAMAQIYVRKGEQPSAEQEVRQALALEPANPDLHTALATIFAGSKDKYVEAEAEFRKAIELAPKSCNPHLLFAGFLFQKRHLTDEAEKEYRLAIDCDTNSAAARVGLGFLLLSKKNYDEADNQFKKALKIDVRSAEAHEGLATIYTELYHNYPAAEDELKKALSLNDKLWSAHIRKGILMYRCMSRPSDGKIEFEKAIAIDPEVADAHFQLGMLLAECYKNESELALKELQKAQSLAPSSALYETKLGFWISQIEKNYKEAETHYRHAIQINNAFPEAHLRLGMLMIEKFGMRKSGDEELRIAHQQNPDEPEIKAAFVRFVGKDDRPSGAHAYTASSDATGTR